MAGRRYQTQIIRHIPNDAIIPNFRNFDGRKFQDGKPAMFLNLDIIEKSQPGITSRLKNAGYPINYRALHRDDPDDLTATMKVNLVYEDPYNPTQLFVVRVTDGEKNDAIPLDNPAELNTMNILEAHVALRAYDYAHGANRGTGVSCKALFATPNPEAPVMEVMNRDPLMDEFNIITD